MTVADVSIYLFACLNLCNNLLARIDAIFQQLIITDLLGCLKPESPKNLDAALVATPTPLTPTKLISPLKGRPFLSPSILFRPSPRKSPQKTPVKTAATTENESPLEEQLKGWRINCRSQIFVYRLVNLVKKAHREFLKQLQPAQELSASDEALLRRWHPDFKLDSVPEVPVAALPEPPETIVRKKHMKDYLDHPSVQLPAKVDEVLGLLKSPEKHKVMGTMGTVDASAKPKDPFLARLERVGLMIEILFALILCTVFSSDPTKGTREKDGGDDAQSGRGAKKGTIGTTKNLHGQKHVQVGSTFFICLFGIYRQAAGA